MVAHHPGRGGAGAFGRGQALLNGGVEAVPDPIHLGELEVEHLAQLVRRGVQVLAGRVHPRFGHGECGRVVLVEHLAPFAVDVVHLVAVVQRVGAVSGGHVIADDLEIVEVVALEVLGQAVRHVHAEAVGAMVEPESQCPDEVGAHFGVLPVPVRLFLGEHVQVPLAVGHAGPGGAAEAGDPVGRRLVAVGALAVAEDVAVAFGGAWAACHCRLEPFVLVGGMVGHDVDDDSDAGRVRGLGELIEVGHGAELGVHVAVVVHVIAAVGKLGGVEGAQPDGIHAQFLEIGNLCGHAGDVAQAGTCGVLERTWVDLVDHGLLPP